MEAQEFELISNDGLELYGKAWVPADTRAVVCLVHGLGEHIGRYQHVAHHFNSQGLAIYGCDQRGHGRSPGKRGHARQEQLWNDVETLMKKARSDHLDLPMFLYGHSWGGNIAANFVLRRDTRELQAVVLTSPWLALSFQPPVWQVKLARMMAGIAPSFTQSNQLNPDHLSRDLKIGKAYRNDPLVHDKISAGLFLDTFNSGQYALEHARELRIPMLLMHGTDDEITSPEASEAFAKASELVTLKLWPQYRHETHNELGKEEVLAYLTDWILNHLL